jgi:hypothetical protein
MVGDSAASAVAVAALGGSREPGWHAVVNSKSTKTVSANSAT